MADQTPDQDERECLLMDERRILQERIDHLERWLSIAIDWGREDRLLPRDVQTIRRRARLLEPGE